MQGIFQKENTDKALKYGIYRHLPTYEKIIRNLVSFCSKKRESNEILSQEEYKDKFLHGDEYIKRELYDEYISRRLSEEFGLKYNEKIKKWHSEWSANRRFVVELCYPRGNHIYLRWGYNYDFIPDINSKNKLTWHRTESSVKIHIADAWYNHIEDEREQDCGYTKEEFYNPRKCTSFQYQIPTYTSDIEFALEYIKNVIDKNIPLIREWINNVQTVDDAITVLNQRIVTLPHIYVPYMCHIRAFLYAKNNDIDNAIESIKQGYENSEIPQVIIDKLVQIANG